MGMLVGNIAKLLKAKVLTPDLDLSAEVNHAFASLEELAAILLVKGIEPEKTVTGKLFKMMRKE